VADFLLHGGCGYRRAGVACWNRSARRGMQPTSWRSQHTCSRLQFGCPVHPWHRHIGISGITVAAGENKPCS
jgi:hypothetical protein